MKIDIQAKCSDCCAIGINDGQQSIELDGYVPKGLGIGGGDYIRLIIDVETGQIEGWDSESIKQQIKEYLLLLYI